MKKKKDIVAEIESDVELQREPMTLQQLERSYTPAEIQLAIDESEYLHLYDTADDFQVLFWHDPEDGEWEEPYHFDLKEWHEEDWKGEQQAFQREYDDIHFDPGHNFGPDVWSG